MRRKLNIALSITLSITLGIAACGAPNEDWSRLESAVNHGNSVNPVLGVALDANYRGPGVIISAVARGSTAERMGLRPGDFIFAIDGTSFSSPWEFRAVEQTLTFSGTHKLDVNIYGKGRVQQEVSIQAVPQQPRPPTNLISEGPFSRSWPHTHSQLTHPQRIAIELPSNKPESNYPGGPTAQLGVCVGCSVFREGTYKTIVIERTTMPLADAAHIIMWNAEFGDNFYYSLPQNISLDDGSVEHISSLKAKKFLVSFIQEYYMGAIQRYALGLNKNQPKNRREMSGEQASKQAQPLTERSQLYKALGKKKIGILITDFYDNISQKAQFGHAINIRINEIGAINVIEPNMELAVANQKELHVYKDNQTGYLTISYEGQEFPANRIFNFEEIANDWPAARPKVPSYWRHTSGQWNERPDELRSAPSRPRGLPYLIRGFEK